MVASMVLCCVNTVSWWDGSKHPDMIVHLLVEYPSCFEFLFAFFLGWTTEHRHLSTVIFFPPCMYTMTASDHDTEWTWMYDKIDV